jgi:hypothetical protein
MQLIEDHWIEQNHRRANDRHNYAVLFDPKSIEVFLYRGREPRFIHLNSGNAVPDPRRPLRAHIKEWLDNEVGEEGRAWRWSMYFNIVSFKEKADAEKFAKWWYIPVEEFYNGPIRLVQQPPIIAPERLAHAMRRQ